MNKGRVMQHNEIESKLDKCYKTHLDKNNLSELFGTDTNIVSAPFLIKVHENYINSDLKILFVGKETNKWWGKLQHFIEFDDSINILKQRYEAEFFGGTVLRSNRQSPKKYKPEQWGNPFFTEFKKIRKSLLNDKKGSLVWSNLLKIDSGIEGTYSKNTINDSRVRDISKAIFLEEFEILKPDIIIFATSYTYDKVIKDIFNNMITDSEVIEKYSLWKFKIGKTICYRTWHPSTIKYNALKNKLEYYEDIIQDIRRTF